MCDREDVKIDVSHKPDSKNMGKFYWQWMFKEISKDYPGFDRVKIIYFDHYYILKGVLVDGENPKFFNEIVNLIDLGFSYYLDRTVEKYTDENGNLMEIDHPF